MEELEFLSQVKQRVITSILGDDELGDRLVLKGGNLLQYAYQITTRASKDIDISVDGEFEDFHALESRVRSCLESSFAQADLVVIDFHFREVPAQMSEDMKNFWGGYQCEFKLVDRAMHESSPDIEHVRRNARTMDVETRSTKFKIDFSRHEFCEEKEEFVVGDYTIFGYSPRMFVAEKLRAICQQMPEYGEIIHRNRPSASRARDFVDIHLIDEHYGIDFSDPGYHEVIRNTFAHKKVPVEWIGQIKDTYGHHELDFESVRSTVQAGYNLQDFRFYFDFVCGRCKQLEPLWNK